MKFFNLDLHISVIADIKYILEEMGHSVTSWSISDHSWVFGQKPHKVDIVNQRTWRSIDTKMCEEFYNCYREELKEYDAFIVTYVPSFAMLYEKFGKPVIVVNPTRYEHPLSSSRERWEIFNRFLQKGIDEKTIIPLANNRYDAAYAQYFTQRQWAVIPSLCLYTKAQYTGKRNKFLWWSKFKQMPRVKDVMDKDTALKRPFYRIFESGYRWQDAADFKGIAHIPYNASVMSIFEQYSANIPLFFPSFDFLRRLRTEFYRQGVLSELSFNQVMGYPPFSVLGPHDGKDPNRYDDNEVMMEWVKLADYYDEKTMPHITYFESFEDLKDILHTADLSSISHQMESANRKKKELVFLDWEKVIKSLA